MVPRLRSWWRRLSLMFGRPRNRLLGVLIVWIAFLLSGCIADPESQFFTITFLYDSHQTLHLSLCTDTQCGTFNYTDTVKPGKEVQEDVSDLSLKTSWQIRDLSGHVAGCITRTYSRKIRGVRISLSRVSPCEG